MKNDNTLVEFIFNPDLPFSKERYNEIKRESIKYLATPLNVIALMVALAGLFAMIFEVRYHHDKAFQVYTVRLTATIISFIVLSLMNSKYKFKYAIPLVHVLLITIIISSGIMILLIPSTIVVNAQIVGLMIFTSAMFLNWEVKNQIVVAIYYNIVFAVAILFNDHSIYFLPNMFESLIFVLFLSFLSVIGSAINFRMRLQIADTQFRTDLSEKKFRSIFHNAIEGIFQATLKGEILTVNPSFIKMLGYETEDEIKALNVKDLYAIPDERDAIIKLLKVKGLLENHVLQLRKKDGSTIFVRLNNRLIADNGGDHLYIEGNIQDITHEIKAELERRKAEEELKTEKEKSDRLAKEALDLSKIKSKFLANMSHEIRTPMNGILGFLSLIENESFSSKAELQQYVNNARLSAETLLETLNAVLDLSKIEAGKIEIEKLNFNINKIVEQAISIISGKAKEKGLIISTELPRNGEANMIGDATKIRQIYLNLLSNAVKFTEHGEIKVIVQTESLPDNKVRLNSSIIDTGRGIPVDKLGELFKPFSQIDGTEGSKIGGTGLGLVICKEFANLMGGDIGVQNNKDRGSKFNFHIIVEAQNNLTARQDHSPYNLSEQTQTDPPDGLEHKLSVEKRGKYKILLAEDNIINQKVAIRTLTSAGYQVDAVVNGEQVIRAHSENNYDLILMDVQMPDVDGFMATKEIRAMKAPLNKVPIIAITAHALLGDKEKCISAGMNDYLSKPAGAKDIVSMIDKHLRINEKSTEKKYEMKKNNFSFDFERLKEISIGDKEFEKDLLSDYLMDAETKLESIRKLLEDKNLDKIADAAHTLKGSSYSVGAKLVGDESYGIELSAKSNDAGSVEERLIKLAKAVRETREIINYYLNTESPA